MNYIENIYICVAAPLLLAIICLRSDHRKTIVFFLIGMTTCLASSYVTTYLTVAYGTNNAIAAVEIAPFSEECMKLFPVVFFLLVFEPSKRDIAGSMLMTSLGFATFENICYLTAQGAEKQLNIIIRGFGTGAMHVVCGMLATVGLIYIWDKLWLRLSGTVGLLALSITYHGIYNLLVARTGVVATVGYIIPMLTIVAVLFFGRNSLKKL